MSCVGRQFTRLVPFCIGFALSAGAGCNKQGAAKAETQAPTGQAPTVTTVRPERKAVERVVEQPAFVEAYEETPLFARIVGYIQKVHVDMGDRVKGPRSDKTGTLTEPG